MANKTLFQTIFGGLIPAPDAINEEQAPAYALTPKQALAQYAATGCFNRTFLHDGGRSTGPRAGAVRPSGARVRAQVAIYARRNAFMKDMPALLCAWLAARAPQLHERVFTQVIDNPKMLRTYVQILRSGVTGRKSLGTAPKRLVRQWLEARDEESLFRGSVGQDPSLADILKMVHP